jgi:chaperonin GroES
VDWNCLYDKLIVKREAAKESYDKDGLLAVADAHKQEQNAGVVIKAGDGRWVDGILLPLTIKPGMTVMFSKFAGVPLESEGPDLLILREDEVLVFRS